jgi:hypothetical protein
MLGNKRGDDKEKVEALNMLSDGEKCQGFCYRSKLIPTETTLDDGGKIATIYIFILNFSGFYCLLLRRRSNRYRVGFNLCPKLHLRDFSASLLPLVDFFSYQTLKRKPNKEKEKNSVDVISSVSFHRFGSFTGCNSVSVSGCDVVSICS